MGITTKATCIKKGKVREVYDTGDNLVIITTDRITTLNLVQPTLIPNKGVLLNKMNEFWFDRTSKIIPNNMITTNIEEMPEEFQKDEFVGRAMMCKKVKMLPVEAVVRGYFTGTVWENYKKLNTVGGIRIFDHIEECQQLPLPLYEPRIKCSNGYKKIVDYEDTISVLQKELGDKGEEYASEIRSKSVKLYNFCSKYAKENGVIIADARFRFGIDEEGYLILASDIMTPDSSRFWSADKYEVGRSQENYTKQYLYNWLEENGYTEIPAPMIPDTIVQKTAANYSKAFKRLVGNRNY